MQRLLGLAILATLTGCPPNVRIYRSLSEPGAMQTCDANQRYRVDVKGSDEADARARGEAQISSTIAKAGGCAALITNDGAGKALDGSWNYGGDYQLCRCN